MGSRQPREAVELLWPLPGRGAGSGVGGHGRETMTKGRRAAEQAVGERAIFSQFARVSELPIRLASIESRDPPEPGPPVVSAGFVPGVSPGKWRRALEAILAVLVERAKATGCDRLAEGEIPVWRLPLLKTLLLTDLAVRRSHGEPFFGAGEATLAVDATLRLLEEEVPEVLQDRCADRAPRLLRRRPARRRTGLARLGQ